MKPWLRKTLVTLVAILVIGGIAVWWITRGDKADYDTAQLTGPRPVFDTPDAQWFPTIGVPDLIGWGESDKPTVPQGLSVARFAQGLDHPRSMLTLPNGDVLVAETNSPPRDYKGIEGWVMKTLLGRVGANSPSANRITLLRDANGDGVAETKSVLVKGLNSPFGMVYQDGTLYVANTDALVSFPFTPGQTRITVAPTKLADLNAAAPNNHWTRGLTLSPDGKLLYISVGSNSNIGDGGMDKERRRAAILEHDIAAKYTRIYAGGLRNPVSMDFNPVNGELWTVVNERDMLGSDLVPDYLTSVRLGDQFGWPWMYWRSHFDERVEHPMPRDINEDYLRRPDYALGAHTAALGLVFAREGQALGPRYADGAFVALHGSWNSRPLVGYKVVFIPFTERGWPVADYDDAASIKAGMPQDILSGFLTDDGDAHGRPTTVTFDSTGALLVTDDTAGIIWRVTAAQ